MDELVFKEMGAKMMSMKNKKHIYPLPNLLAYHFSSVCVFAAPWQR